MSSIQSYFIIRWTYLTRPYCIIIYSTLTHPDVFHQRCQSMEVIGNLLHGTNINRLEIIEASSLILYRAHSTIIAASNDLEQAKSDIQSLINEMRENKREKGKMVLTILELEDESPGCFQSPKISNEIKLA